MAGAPIPECLGSSGECCPINTLDTNTIDLSGDGSIGTPLEADAIISPDVGNVLVAQPNGLYVSATAGLPTVWARITLQETFVTTVVPSSVLFLLGSEVTEGAWGVFGTNLVVPNDGLYVISTGIFVCDSDTPFCYPAPAIQQFLSLDVLVNGIGSGYSRRTTLGPPSGISDVTGDQTTTAECTFIRRLVTGDVITVFGATAFDIAGLIGTFNPAPHLGGNRLFIARIAA